MRDHAAPGGAPAGRRGSSAFSCCEHCGHVELGESPGHEYPCRAPGCRRCPSSISGECLKSVSASVYDHPACVERCELNPWAAWNIHCGPCSLRFETLGDLYVHAAEVHDAGDVE